MAMSLRVAPGARRRTLMLIGLMLPLSACGGEDSDADPPSSTPTSGASASASASGSPTTAPTDEPTPVTPSVTPADGEIVDHLDGYTANAPRGWRISSRSAIDASYRKGDGNVRFFGIATAGPNDTDALAADVLDDYPDAKLERAEDRVVDGVPGYVVTGRVQRYEFFYRWGAKHNAQFVSLQVSLPTDSPDAMALVDSVLASWKWK